MLRDSAYAACDLAGVGVNELNEAELGFELQLLNEAIIRLKARIEGLSDDINYRIHDGKQVPGFSLVAVVGREAWTKPVDEIIVIGSLFGIDLSKPGVKTPAQARKLGIPDEVTKGLSERPVTSPTVKPTGKFLSKIFY
jgi:hypothetical protein